MRFNGCALKKLIICNSNANFSFIIYGTSSHLNGIKLYKPIFQSFIRIQYEFQGLPLIRELITGEAPYSCAKEIKMYVLSLPTRTTQHTSTQTRVHKNAHTKTRTQKRAHKNAHTKTRTQKRAHKNAHTKTRTQKRAHKNAHTKTRTQKRAHKNAHTYVFQISRLYQEIGTNF